MKPQLLLFFLSALLTPIMLIAQTGGVTLEWAQYNSGTGAATTVDIAISDSGFVYVVGRFEDTIDVDPGPNTMLLVSAGDKDMFIQKLNSDGTLIWAKRIGGSNLDEIQAVAVDQLGNVYCTGSFSGTVDFNPGTGTNNLVSNGGSKDVFVLKLSAAGNYVWARRMGNSGVDVGYDIAVDAAGNVYTTGSFVGTVDFNPGSGTANLVGAGNQFADVFIQKLNSSGNYLWAKKVGGNDIDMAYGIALDSDANIYTTGFFGGIVDFDPDAIGTDSFFASPSRDVFVLKLNTAGTYVWAKQLDGTLFNSQGRDIAIDSARNIYLTGYFVSTVDFDPGPDTFYMTPLGGNDPFILKLDSLGGFRWAKQLGGISSNQGYALAIDAESSVYTTGYFSTSVDFDPGTDTYNMTSDGGFDVFVQKLDSAGQFMWAHKIGSTGSDRGEAIAVDSLGNIYTGGSFSLTVDFDPTLAGSTTLTSAGSTDAFITKWSQCNPTILVIDTTTCYTFTSESGNTYTTTGTYTESYLNASGCDSLVTINLTINDTTYQTLTETACDSFVLNGQRYDSTGTYVQLLANAAGCDSILTLELTINTIEATVAQTEDTLTATTTGASYQWLDCENLSPIVGATDSVFVPTISGNYALTVSANGCTDTSACFNIVIIGINESFGERFSLYPNPTMGGITIALGGHYPQVQVTVSTLTGQTMSTATHHNLSALELYLDAPAGMYLVTLTSAQGQRVLKVVKE